MIGFAAASVLGGAAGSFEILALARALQGVSSALLAPAALSLLTTLFTDAQGLAGGGDRPAQVLDGADAVAGDAEPLGELAWLRIFQASA
ncbi:hypothetical protein ACFQ61_31860 [Streptomyces sp. NPDC056500]|uniref:hypothetical protein n=1 Tax=Streptomyces sp. NPDC056500 TaxID=3345840 RepID=UPI0036877716